MPDIPQQSGLLGSVDWTDNAKAAQGIKDFYEQRDQKRFLEAIAARNWAFLDGQQQREWCPETRRMEIPLRRKREQDYLVYNMLGYMMARKLSKLSRSEPVWNVSSFTSDEHDQMVARFGNDLLAEYYREILDMPAKSEKTLRRMLSSPVVWLEPAWDPMAGDPITITPDIFMPDVPQGASADQINQLKREARERFNSLLNAGPDAGKVGYVTQYQGDIRVHIRTIFETMWYPFIVSDWDQVHAYLISVVMSPEEVSQRYHVPMSRVLMWRNGSDAQEHYNKIVRGWSSPYIEMPGLDESRDFGVLVHIFHGDKFICPPTPENPKGGVHAVVIGNANECVILGPLGNAQNVLPMFPLVENASNIFAWGTSSIDAAIPAQVELNNSRTERARWRRDCKLKPRLVVSQADGNTEEKRQAMLRKGDAPYVVKNMAEKPQPLITPSDDFGDDQADAFNERFIQDVMATPDVDLGRTDSTLAKSGTAIANLKSGANEQLIIVGKQLNRVFSRIGSFILCELQQKAEAPRLIALTGDNGQKEWKIWSAASLRPGVYDIDPSKAATVNVSTFSNLPNSPEEIQAKIALLYNLGILKPGVHDRLVAEAFGLGDYRTILDKGRAGRDKAQLQVERWKSGEMVQPVSRTDDHAEMIDVYKRFVASDDYVNLCLAEPFIQQEIDAHLEQHQFELYAEQAREEARAILAQAQVAKEYMARAMAMGLPSAFTVFSQRAGAMVDPNAVAQTQIGARNDQQETRRREEGGSSAPQAQRQTQQGQAGAGQQRHAATAA